MSTSFSWLLNKALNVDIHQKVAYSTTQNTKVKTETNSPGDLQQKILGQSRTIPKMKVLTIVKTFMLLHILLSSNLQCGQFSWLTWF